MELSFPYTYIGREAVRISQTAQISKEKSKVEDLSITSIDAAKLRVKIKLVKDRLWNEKDLRAGTKNNEQEKLCKILD